MPKPPPNYDNPASRAPVPIGQVLKGVSHALRVSGQHVLAVQEALTQVLEPELIGRVEVVGVHGGVVRFRVADAASRCVLEAMLRAGGLQKLQKLLPGMVLRRAKVVLT